MPSEIFQISYHCTQKWAEELRRIGLEGGNQRACLDQARVPARVGDLD